MSETIITKRCSQCHQIKPLSEFCKHRSQKDGHNYCCKVCKQAYQRSEKGKIAQKRYGQSKKGKLVNRRKIQKFKKCHPEKNRAHSTVYYAIKVGKLPHPDIFKCSYCPKQAEQYHHPDYSKPLEVEPVCLLCHTNLSNQ